MVIVAMRLLCNNCCYAWLYCCYGDTLCCCYCFCNVAIIIVTMVTYIVAKHCNVAMVIVTIVEYILLLCIIILLNKTNLAITVTEFVK